MFIQGFFRNVVNSANLHAFIQGFGPGGSSHQLKPWTKQIFHSISSKVLGQEELSTTKKLSRIVRCDHDLEYFSSIAVIMFTRLA